MAQKNILSIFSGDDKENNNFNMDLFQVNNFEPKNQINSDLNLTQQNTNPNFETNFKKTTVPNSNGVPLQKTLWYN